MVALVGIAEAETQSLAEFSMGGNGAGLNAIVAKAVHPSASSTDRTHVHTVRISSGGGSLRPHPTLGPNLMIGRAVFSGGILYDVPNPLCRFSKIADL